VIKFTFLGIVLFLLIYSIFFIPNAKSWDKVGTTISCSSCSDCSNALINSTLGDTIALNKTITGVVGTCINFQNRSGVIFDCTNYSYYIQGNGTGAVYGINITSVNNNTIRNCNISQFSSGVFISSSKNNTLINITSNSNLDSGIYLSSSNNTIIKNVTLISNVYGLRNSNSQGNNISNSVFQENVASDSFFELNSPTYCSNNFTNVTGSGNHPIVYYNLPAIIQNDTFSEIILCNASSSSLSNLTVQGSNIFGNNGIYSYYTNNTNFSKINSSYNYYGEYVQNSYNLNFTDIATSKNVYGLYFTFFNDSFLTDAIANNNSVAGLTLLNSSNNTFVNITTNYNAVYGIFLKDSPNNTFFATNTSNNSYGIYMRNSSYVSFSHGFSGSNSVGGLYLFNIVYDVMTNMTLMNNLYGVGVEGIISYNVVKDSFIQFSGLAGIAINASGTTPQYNYFYNNYFNDTLAFYNPLNYVDPALLTGFNWSSLQNYFNTTLTAKENIIHGAYSGGNYWATPNGTGFSQNPLNCTDTGNGICNVPYTLDAINFDYLPLMCHESWSCGDWGRCNDEVQKRTCTDANLCQTYVFKPADSQHCQSQLVAPPKGGGGGASFSSTIKDIASNKPVEIIINNSNMDLNSLILNVKKEVTNSSMVITKLNETTELKMGLPIGKLYQAFEIEPGFNNSDIINATLNFRINKIWLKENNITFHYKGSNFWLIQNDIVGNIKLYRNPDGNHSWVPLITSFSSEDNQSYHFYSYSPGFSTFAIFFNKYDCLPNSARCADNQVQLCLGNSTWLVTETCSDVCRSGKCESFFFKSSQFYIVLGTVAAGIIAIIIIILTYKKGKNKNKQRRR
jgi:PGF-pre-PGF domain-containing protein